MVGYNRQEKPDIWPEINKGLDNLLHGEKVTMTREAYMKHYTAVYNKCIEHRPKNISGASFNGGAIYSNLRKYLIAFCDEIRKKAEDMSGENLLRYLNKEWTRYVHASKTMNGIFVYLNRHYVRRSQDSANSDSLSANNSIEDLGTMEPHQERTCHDITCEVSTLCMVTWRDMIFHPLHSGIIEATLDLIGKERKGEMIDHNLIFIVKECLTNIDYTENVAHTPSPDARAGTKEKASAERSLNLYENFFVKPFLVQTKAHYEAESAQLLADNPITECMKKFDQFIEDEAKRVTEYLHKSTAEPLENVCKQSLITIHLEHFNSEFVALLKDEKDDDVALMYRLLESVSELSFLAERLQKHIHQYGLEQIEKISNQALESPEIYSRAILTVHEKFQKLVTKSFDKNPMFVESLDKACRQFVNKNAVTKAAKKVEKSSELLAKHCDGLLRKSSKASDEELEQNLSHIMTVFVYIEDKHVFQKYYSQHLAKRLVNDTSLSDDAESSMISKLKSACGYEYTGKLQRMFTDISVSKGLMEKFQARLKDSAQPLKHDFNAKIITDGSWPIRRSNESFLFPDQLQKSLDRFEQFYSDKHNGRRLNWIVQHSKGELRTTHLKRPVILQASAHQMAILLHFNTCTETTVTDLMNATEMKFPFMQSNLVLLNKTKLIKVANVDSMDETTKVTLNPAFQSKKAKLNINLPIKMVKEAEQKETEKSIQQDRELIIQATLVRIMKMRKTLKHTDLINESMTQLANRFQPKVALIKKMIDVLIEKDYLCRAEGQKDVYNYVA